MQSLFAHYISIAYRNMTRNKFQTIFAVVGLAVAFFCFGICMYFVNGFSHADSYYEKSDRVMAVNSVDGVNGGIYRLHGTQQQELDQLVQQFPEVESVFRFNIEHCPYRNEELDVDVELVTIECDTTLRHIYEPRLIAGSWEGAMLSTNSFLMTESAAKRYFGKVENAIGKQFTVMGGKRNSANTSACPTYTVQAVVEDLAYNNTFQPFCPMAAWVMNDTDGNINCENQASVFYYDPRVLIREGVDIEELTARVENARIVHNRRGDDEWIVSFRNPNSHDGIDNWVFCIIMLVLATPGLLILLSALSNFFHLLLSAIMMRRREYTLRRAHGAHTWDLWLMVSTQVVMMMVAVGVCTMIIVELFSPMLQIDLGSYNKLVLDPNEMLRQSAAHIGVLLIIGFGVAWLAVARIRKDSLQESMKTSTGRRPGRHIGRNILMGWQMVIGFLFVTILAALILQIRVNEEVQLPWLSKAEKQLTLCIPISVRSYAEFGQEQSTRDEFESFLRSIPSVEKVGFCPATSYFFDIHINYYGVKFTTPDGVEVFANSTGICDSLSMRFINVPLFEGRWPEKLNEVVVDQNFVDKYHLGVGTVLVADPEEPFSNIAHGEALQIVGVIDNVFARSGKNVGGASLNHAPGLYCVGRSDWGYCACRAYPGQYEQMKSAIVEHLKERHGVEYHLKSLYDEIQESNDVERQFLGIAWLFAAIALIITLLGIFSAITVDTTSRRKEMAIRKINGAKTHHIALRFARLYLVLMVICAAIAFPLTYILFYVMSDANYRVTFDFGFLFYAGIFLLMGLFVALTVGIQIWKISHINPSSIIKAE